jgi:hypothetical protein
MVPATDRDGTIVNPAAVAAVVLRNRRRATSTFVCVGVSIVELYQNHSAIRSTVVKHSCR